MENALKKREQGHPVPVELETFMAQTMQLMQGMAEMVRATNERMTELEQQVRMLEKVTPSQASDLNAAIRERAAAACKEYRMTGMEKPVAAAIRKTMRLATGARSVREIARCDYKPVRELVATWVESARAALGVYAVPGDAFVVE